MAHEGQVADELRREASELFAAYVAQRADGELVDFEQWVSEHPAHERSLRELYEHWPSFERELGRLRHIGPAPGPALELCVGAVVGGFRLIEELGKGGMGSVWRARHGSRELEVALKVILPERRSTRGISFFAREERAMRRIDHPGVVRVYDAGVDEGVHWIAQEYVAGGRTLAHFIDEGRSSGQLTPAYFLAVARLFARIAEAVAAAHDVDVIHRDLKPQNVLLAAKDAPKVTDFGLARILDENALSNTGDLAGTYYYMSPEQVAAKRIGIDHRTDVFSLGVMLYEALTLRRPFQAPSNPEIMEKILYEDPPDPCRISGEVPVELAWICAKAMEKRRGDRFASMGEMRAELQRFLAEQPIRTRPPGPFGRARRTMLRYPMRCALAAVVLLAILAIGISQLEVGASRRHARGLEVEAELRKAESALVHGNRAGMQLALARARELAPQDPRPHLHEAYAKALTEDRDEVARGIAEAVRKGYAPRTGADASAEELRNAGLFLFCANDPAKRAAAEQVLERAVALEESLHAAHFLIYRLRAARDDFPGALDALRKCRTWLSEGAYPELRRLLAALELEMQGEHGAAQLALQELKADAGADPERLASLDIDGFIGRAALHEAEFDVAIEALRAAVEREPSPANRTNLAYALMGRAGVAESYEEELEGLREARNEAALAVEADPLHPDALRCAATIAMLIVQSAGPRASDDDWGDAWQSLTVAQDHLPYEDLRRVAGQLRILDAHLHALAARDYSGAVEGFEEGLRDYPEHITGHYLLGQALWFLGDYAESQAKLERALGLWTSTDEVRRHELHESLLGGIHAWMLWAAGMQGFGERCEDALAALEALPDEGAELEPRELITFAEFLAEPPGGLDRLHDCDRVRALFEAADLWAKIDGDPILAKNAEGPIRTIETRCYPEGR